MKKYRTRLFFLLTMFLTSCTALPLSTPSNFTELSPLITATETKKTTEQESAQLPDNEVVMLLRPLDENRIDIVGIDANCFEDPDMCKIKTISHLPKNMPQVLEIFWLEDGIHALFWDSDSGKIYQLNRSTGKIQLIKEKVWKTQSYFLLSPDGMSVLYDSQKNAFENGIVLMDVNSGETKVLDINVGGMKRITQWLNNDKFLFWTEIYSGQKGYLDDIEVYTFDISTQKLQEVDMSMNWLITSPPYYSPDMKTFVMSTKRSIFFFDKNNNKTKAVNINKEAYLWSPDSTKLVVYTQEKSILILNESDDKTKQIFIIPEDAVLNDWYWLPGSDDLLLVLCKIEDGKTSLIKYSLINDTITTINWPILSKVNIVSLSYRTMKK